MLPTRKKRIQICKEKINLLVQTIINSKVIIDTKDMKGYLKKSYPSKAIEDCVAAYGLEITEKAPFIMWPVFMGTVADNINICAVNFGALTLFEKNANGSDSQLNEYVNAAVNVLVVANMKKIQNDVAYRYWPTNIDYSNKIEWGTINQASLSLTSLFKFGFLEKKSVLNNSPLDEEIRINRFRFFAENLTWILKLQNSCGNSCAAWAYAENCKDVENGSSITTAIVPSQFCYELVKRVYIYFCSNEENKKIINGIDPELLAKMEKACTMYENWVANSQKEDGGYGRNNNSATSSFAHSCCAMLTYVYNDKKSNEKTDTLRLRRLISYLTKHHKNFNFETADISDTYKYQYQVDNKIGYVEDVYEIFPETLFLINCCKNIDDDENELVNGYYKWVLRCINYKSYEKIFNRLETIQINDTQNNAVVRGRQQLSHKYPIYVLYYAKTCLQRLKDNDEKPSQSRRKYISLPLLDSMKPFILFLLLALCVLFAYIINPSDTLITLILSVATFIVPVLYQIFFNNGNRK